MASQHFHVSSNSVGKDILVGRQPWLYSAAQQLELYYSTDERKIMTIIERGRYSKWFGILINDSCH